MNNPFPQQVLSRRRLRIVVDETPLIFVPKGKKVALEREDRPSRRLMAVNLRGFYAAADQARRYFCSLRPAALRATQQRRGPVRARTADLAAA